MTHRDERQDFINKLMYYLFTKDEIKPELRKEAVQNILMTNPDQEIPKAWLERIREVLK
jgi:hypothetical protein